MVIDSSALHTILFGESDAGDFIDALANPGRKFMSSVNKLEASIVVEVRKGSAGAAALVKLLATAEIEVIPLDSGQAEIAMAAWRRYGRGRHPAGLNLGDCAAYALASTLNDSILYKGEDFSKTELLPAIPQR
jgi:ribonuclease VapC